MCHGAVDAFGGMTGVKKCLAPNYNCLVVSKSMLDCGAYSDKCGLIMGRAGKTPSVLPE
jgi:hypothetical protein